MNKAYLIRETATLRDAWVSLNQSAVGICLVVDAEEKLLFTITDGDIRRAVLGSISIDDPISKIAKKGAAITALEGSSDQEVLKLMAQYKVLHVPILDVSGKVVDLKLLRDLAEPTALEMDALVMAGGFGKRLMPLTEDTPKPMLPVGGKPILEHIVEQLKGAQVQKVLLSTHYRAEVIQDHFGHGERFGVDIDYVHEDSPLGTAGALGLVGEAQKPLLVMNGDVITNVDLRALLQFHTEQSADITVGVARYQFQVPYGVIECDDFRITGISEKPQTTVFVSAGVYLISPQVVKGIQKGEHLDMPDLILRVVKSGGVAVSFPIVEYWLDVGGHAEYERANAEFKA